MIGTRGVPASYGGFETAVEEIGRRLVQRGHEVTVYTRPEKGQAQIPHEYLGMVLVPLPAVHRKSLETLTHTGVSVGHLISRRRPDAGILFNAANAIYLPALRSRGIPVATHVDGLEWRRSKWGGAGHRFYRMSEALAVRWSDALIADAPGIAAYYREEFGATTDLITYGAPLLTEAPASDLPASVVPDSYHLIVARFEPENHVLEAVRGFVASAARHPLVVVGGAPFAAEYTERIQRACDERVRLLGPIYDQPTLDALYFHANTYVHGHSVGGTNPSLLRAMGAGTTTLAYDVVFNRDVLGVDGRFWSDPLDLATLLEKAEIDPVATAATGEHLRTRAAEVYDWDRVTDLYEDLASRLSTGQSQAGRYRRRRRSTWAVDAAS
mgnify:CR=1 FL=1